MLLRKEQAEQVTGEAQITNLLTPSNVFVTGAGETTDWGISDIEADKLSGKARRDDGVLFGALDGGLPNTRT